MSIGWKVYLKFTLGLIAIACAMQSNSQDIKPGAHYVNMGSSFAAASGVEPVRPASGRCWQSERGYASLLASSLKLELEDRSCGGAKSTHLLESWDELPPQIEAVNSRTKLVTITVGGNDLNYVGNLMAVTTCASAGQDKSQFCPEWTTVNDGAYAKVKNNLIKAIKQISTRAPDAKVIFIQYLSLIPDKLCETTPLTEPQANQMRAVGQRLAVLTAEAAEEGGASIISADELSASHTSCDIDPWTIGSNPTTENAEGAPWHINRRGNEVIAELLQKELGL